MTKLTVITTTTGLPLTSYLCQLEKLRLQQEALLAIYVQQINSVSSAALTVLPQSGVSFPVFACLFFFVFALELQCVICNTRSRKITQNMSVLVLTFKFLSVLSTLNCRLINMLHV